MKLFILGFMGAGKTHWGKKLSTALQLPWVDLDHEIVKGEGRDIPAIFEKDGEAYFRQLEHHYLKKLTENENILIACGGGTPCYLDNMPFMNKEGLTLWLNVPVEVMANRLKRNMNERPLLKDLNDTELKEYVEKKLTERRYFYEQAKLIVNPIKYTVQTLTQKIKSCTELS